MPEVVGLKPVLWLVIEAQILVVNYTPVQPSSLVLEHYTTGKGRARRYQGTLHWSENGECERRVRRRARK